MHSPPLVPPISSPPSSTTPLPAAATAATVASAAAAAEAANAISFAATSAAYAANATIAAKATKATKASATIAATTATAAYAAAAYTRNTKNLESIILRDIEAIKSNEEENQHGPTDLYGENWDSFEKALEAENCVYWGKLYKGIFDSGFVLDQKALERRINVPNEIREQGAAAVANYLEELEKGATRLNEARILILGNKGAGKTSIARKLIDPDADMPTDKESTAGVDTMLWKLEHENINVRIWDFAGHTVTHAVHQFFLSERCLYIIVYDGRTEERNRLEYWLNHMKNYGGDSKAIILVNRRDQHSVEIPINFLKEQYPIAGVYTFSIEDDKTELEGFRNDVADYINNNPSWENQEIPTNYYHVKDELENFFAKGEEGKSREHITRDEFNKIAVKYGVENKEELLKDLHFLGVSLWYKDMEEFDTLVLNPEWISQGVYKIINWVNEDKEHSLTLHDFETVFKEDKKRYPKEQHKFLFKLMKHYELAYEAESGELIIPHLLEEDRPDELPDFPVGESLMLRYRAEQPLPPNTISRFIVRHNQEIKKEDKDYVVWRLGVVLEDGKGSIALVREEDRIISVSVKGKDKTNYISKFRETLNDVFNSYKSEKPELQYRIERFGEMPGELEAEEPIWLADSKVFNLCQREKPYYDDIADQNIPMAGVINIYNIKAENVISGGAGNMLIQPTFYFRDCNISLQGNLNELAQLLTNGGKEEEAEELANAASALERVEKSESREEVKKKGAANSLKRILDALNNKESKLHKTVKGIKNGIGIAQDIAKGYNDTAQWLGLPQVPKPFLR
ncbi:MAG: hypothetical protein HOI47_00635 [Candidatus Scalindua sp.]|nr:hypothetical protein [Candidatus Scalindua sp.]